MTRREFVLSAAAAMKLDGIKLGVASTCFMTARRPKDTIELLEYSHSLGAAGLQAPLASLESDYLRKLRGRAEQLAMYLEVMSGLRPERFPAEAAAAREIGALAFRAAAPGPRRYEAFATLDDWKKAEVSARRIIESAVLVAEKVKIPIGLENHRDRTLDELVELLKSFSSEYLGACLDFGNNIALLDDPMEVVERLAPFAVSTHVKDSAVEEYPDGFLLADVPLGKGFVDVATMVATVRKARPNTRLTLEMITRDPTPVACLRERYWAALPERPGRYMARTLALVRSHRPAAPLPYPQRLDRAALLRLEENNVKECLS